MRRIRVRPLVAFVILLLTAVLPIAPSPEARAGGSSISGVVVDEVTGQPVVGAQWTLRRKVSAKAWYHYADYPTTKQTDAEGRFALQGLESGIYSVEIHTTNSHVGRWYGGGGLGSSREVVVPSAEASSIRVPLPAAGHIKGTIKSDVDGSPVANAKINVIHRNADGSFDYVGGATTDEFGNYDAGGLETGSYLVEVDPGPEHLKEYWPNTSSEAKASTIQVALGKTTAGIDLSLAKAARITGRVRWDGSRTDVPAGLTGAAHATTGTGPDNVSIASDGTFTIGGLRPGSYRVHFWIHGSGLEWFEDAATREEARLVSVTAASTTTIGDVFVDPPSTIRGRVTDEQGHPIAGVRIYGGPIGTRYTKADGTYEYVDVPPGSYGLSFHHDEYLTEHYDDARSDEDETRVVVAPGEVRSGVDAVLTKGAVISGVMTAPDGSPLANGAVLALRLWPHGWSGEKSVRTSASGQFTLPGLPAGTYTLEFTARVGTPYVSSYLGTDGGLSTARRVVLSAGETLGDQDGTVVREAAVSGSVRIGGLPMIGKPVAIRPIAVDAYHKTYDDFRTASDGGYASTEGLLPGRYRIAVYCDAPGMFTADGRVDFAGVAYVDLVAGQRAVRDLSFPASACTIDPVRVPRLTTANRVGQTLRFRADTYSPGAVRRHYAWAVGTRRIGTTRPDLKLLSSFRGKRVTARLIVERRGYKDLVYIFRSGIIR